MNAGLASVLTVVSYVVVGGLVIVGSRYGIVDSATTQFILGGVLAHLGFVGVPGVTNAVKTAQSSGVNTTPTPPPVGGTNP